MTNDRLQIFPTRMNLNTTKIRLKSAEKGFTLLKRKSDALQKKHREIQLELETLNQEINEVMRDAFFTLTEAEFQGAHFNIYLNEVKKRCKVNVQIEEEKVGSVALYKFIVSNVSSNFTYLDKGGVALKKSRNKFLSVFELLIKLASLKSSFEVLDEVLKSVNRRVNALEFMVVPRLMNTVEYINGELDELDREEFYRLKKVQKMMKREEK